MLPYAMSLPAGGSAETRRQQPLPSVAPDATTEDPMTASAVRPFDVRSTGFPVLQPGTADGSGYLAADPDHVLWGRLPCAADEPALVVAPGAVVTVDTLSHEGILEDQGRGPDGFFARHGVAAADVLDDACTLAASDTPHDFDADGPHVITGPIAVRGAKAGDLLSITVLDLTP